MKPFNRLLAFLFVMAFLLACGCEKNSTQPPPPTNENPYRLIQGGYPDWSPTGEKLAFIRDNDLYIYYFADSLTGKAAFEERIAVKATEPSFAPDGKKIAFERDRRIYMFDLETRQERFLAEGITPGWSENGKWIAFGHKEAQKVLTDGTQILGQPSPDSSLYYYDLQSDSIVRVLITNYDSLHIGTLLSMSHPEWAMGDSILLFDTELGIWKVKKEGGQAVLFWLGFDNTNLNKATTSPELAFSGQQRWSKEKRLMIYFITEDLRPFGDVIKKLEIVTPRPDYFRAYGIFVNNDNSDPAWSPDGNKIACVANGEIWIKNISDIYEQFFR